MDISPTQSPTRVILIACGSFNPVTNMHMRMFELARDSLNKTGKYQVVGGIMSPVSDYYSKKDLEKASDRCEMVRLALQSMKWVRLDSWESEQEKWTETLHVLEHHNSKQLTVDSNANISLKNILKDEVDSTCVPLKNLYVIQPTVQIKLLCGADLLESFAKPGLWKEEDLEQILSKYGLVCVTRENSDPRKLIYENDILSKYQENIFIVTEWIQNDISSTKIRRAMRRGESVKFLLQEPVIDYIYQHQLYNINSFKSNKNLNKIVNPMFHNISMTTTEERSKYLQSSKFFSFIESSSHSPKRQREFDETDYIQHSPKRMTCMGDIGGLMRKVKSAGMAFTPETCV